jgi:cobalt-zinc-cadmium efflux system outer membrane protein
VSLRATLGALACALLSTFAAQLPAHADDVPAPVVLPARLSMDEALRILRTRGLDLLIADAAVMGAEGDVHAAAALPNPAFSVGAGPALNYETTPPCSGCQKYAVQWTASDSGALSDAVFGKRALRTLAARASLAVARLGRDDALRNLASGVHQQYVAVVFAAAQRDFAREVVQSMTATLELTRNRYPTTIDEGGLARVEVQKLEADQALAAAELALRQARVGLALLLGVRGAIPDFEVDSDPLTFRVPKALAAASEPALVELAASRRPDLRAAEYQRLRADSALRLADRQRIPSIALGVQYQQLGMGQNVGQPMTLTFGISTTLPVFYQQQGEIRRAQSDVRAQALARDKAAAQVTADVGAALAAFEGARAQVARLEGGLLARSRRARDVVEAQYRAGSASLMDLLDAERSYIATHAEHLTDLAACWTAVYQLEQAVGTELDR